LDGVTGEKAAGFYPEKAIETGNSFHSMWNERFSYPSDVILIYDAEWIF